MSKTQFNQKQKRSTLRVWRSMCLITLMMTTSAKSFADEQQGWKGEIMPYIWYAGLEGEGKIRGKKIDFDKSANDLFNAVKAGGSLMAALQYNRFVLWGQADSFSLSTDELDSKDQPLGVKFDSNILIVESAFGYRIDGWMPGQTFDLMLGGRSTHMENELKFKDGAKFSGNSNITDPMIFVRPSIAILTSKTSKLRLNPTLGFGGGGDSKTVYELFPQIQYQFTENLAGRLGYRTVAWKFKDADERLDLNLAGLVAGLGGIW